MWEPVRLLKRRNSSHAKGRESLFLNGSTSLAVKEMQINIKIKNHLCVVNEL